MATKPSSKQTDINQRLEVCDLNLGADPKISFMRKCSLVLAGMYTGIGCAGVAKTYHPYDRRDGMAEDEKPL